MTKRRFRIPLRIIIPIFILIITVCFFLLAKPVFNIDIGLKLIKKDKNTASVAILTEIRNICCLNTVEYIYKTVFPYDFIPLDVNYAKLIKEQREGRKLYARELEYIKIYDLCREIGIDPESSKCNFVVVTSLIKGGFIIKGTVYENPEAYKKTLSNYVTIKENTIILKLPEPEITSFVIEDSTSKDYSYPDLPITPDNWKKLTSFIADKIKTKVLRDGILETASENGQKMIKKLLTGAGYKEILFIDN